MVHKAAVGNGINMNEGMDYPTYASDIASQQVSLFVSVPEPTVLVKKGKSHQHKKQITVWNR